MIHGAPTLNTLYWTDDRDDDFCRKMARRADATAGDVIAFGHTHVPWHREVDGVHFVNTGSVGQPKDGDWRAGYAVIDLSEGGFAVGFERLDYDLEATINGIFESELPDELAYYLQSGGTSLEPSEAG